MTNSSEVILKDKYIELLVQNNRLKNMVLNYFEEPIGDLPIRPIMKKNQLKKRLIEICKK